MLHSELHLIRQKEGAHTILSGNASLARALVEANVDMVTSYPGTPCCEAVENLHHLSQLYPMSVEWNSNEKVAFEKAYAVATLGLRAAFITKSVGMNTILDSLVPSCYSGIRGGLVLISADDPGAANSPVEEDTRIFARLGHFIGLMPSSIQEIHTLTKKAFAFSESSQLPVLIVISGALLYSKENVTICPVTLQKKRTPSFIDDRHRWFIAGKTAVKRHAWLLSQHKELQSIIDNSGINTVLHKNKSDQIIVTTGITHQYVLEALTRNKVEDRYTVFKIAGFHPLGEKEIKEVLLRPEVSRIYIFEELEPLIEEQIRIIASTANTAPSIYGKLTGDVPRSNALNVSLVESSLQKMQLIPPAASPISHIADEHPPQTPYTTFCPGCPHRKSLYLLRKALLDYSRSSNKTYFVATDIGCYALGAFPPLHMGNILSCMGASINIAAATAQFDPGKLSIALIGDSTFLHSGVQALLDAAYRNAPMLVFILDNQSCAMTGQQTTPGTSQPRIIPAVIKALGIKNVTIINPNKFKESHNVISKQLKQHGLRVIVSRDPCAQLKENTHQHNYQYAIDSQDCTQCHKCISSFGCPAIQKKGSSFSIINELCARCGFCTNVCSKKAIRKKNDQ